MTLVSFVERDDHVEIPEGLEGVVTECVMSFVEGSSFDRVFEGVYSFVEEKDSYYGVMSSVIREAEGKR